jgi:uncharacterized protein (DUF1330 family)
VGKLVINNKIKIKMAAYVIVEVDIHDPLMYEEYKKLTPSSISAHGGRFVVRGGNAINIEGDWDPKRIVILEFPDLNTAQAWWNSSEYSKARSIRQKSASTKMIMVEGV